MGIITTKNRAKGLKIKEGVIRDATFITQIQVIKR